MDDILKDDEPALDDIGLPLDDDLDVKKKGPLEEEGEEEEVERVEKIADEEAEEEDESFDNINPI